MALIHTPVCDFGANAPDFRLPDPDGKQWSLQDCRGERGTLVMFICNHCPYVQAVGRLIAADTRALLEHGVRSVAVMPNDYRAYPEDAPKHMRALAAELGFSFPYLIDETQNVARAYGAVCTPDFFGYNADLKLQYRGRLDATTPGRPAPKGTPRELLEAMIGVARNGQGPWDQTPSQGCSIKWREA
ncbi:MAG TPA: thioredoxin family protein [Gammaproteobacteria bacterium]|nr:thioredoxin family protein [Gammaproteobacteria bacterium]